MNDKKNASGCYDLTAFEAIRNVDDDERFHKLLHSIFDICELSGFQIEGRIILVDKRSGKLYR